MTAPTAYRTEVCEARYTSKSFKRGDMPYHHTVRIQAGRRVLICEAEGPYPRQARVLALRRACLAAKVFGLASLGKLIPS